ncbi:MAG: hypothetical protein ACRDEA_22660 [Microcystaceae cyanobacterium]
MKLRTLLTLQFLYAVMAMAYLTVSYMQMRAGRGTLSTAPPIPAMALFVVYAACLLFGVYRKHMPYRIAMAVAIPILAWGGVRYEYRELLPDRT